MPEQGKRMEDYHELFFDYKYPAVNVLIDNEELKGDWRSTYIDHVVCETSVDMGASYCMFDVTSGFLAFKPMISEGKEVGVYEDLSEQAKQQAGDKPVSIFDRFKIGREVKLQLGYIHGIAPPETRSKALLKSRSAVYVTVFVGYITRTEFHLENNKITLKVECMDVKELMMHNCTVKNFNLLQANHELDALQTIVSAYSNIVQGSGGKLIDKSVASYSSTDYRQELESKDIDKTTNLAFELCSDYVLACKIAEKYGYLFFVVNGNIILNRYPTIKDSILPADDKIFSYGDGISSKGKDTEVIEITPDSVEEFSRSVDWYKQVSRVKVIGTPSIGKIGEGKDPSKEPPYIVGIATYDDIQNLGGGEDTKSGNCMAVIGEFEHKGEKNTLLTYLDEASKNTQDSNEPKRLMDLTLTVIDHSANTKEKAISRAKIELEKIARNFVKGEFTTNKGFPLLQPGKKVTFKGFGKDYDYTYLITKVRHEIDVDSSYKTTCEFRGSVL